MILRTAPHGQQAPLTDCQSQPAKLQAATRRLREILRYVELVADQHPDAFRDSGLELIVSRTTQQLQPLIAKAVALTARGGA